MIELNQKQQKAMKLVIGYPFVLFAISFIPNLFFIPDVVATAVPNQHIIIATAITAILFVINHSWLMTVTETTRVKYKLYATPEEWRENDLDPNNASEEAKQALERCHNAHRNTTENTIYFVVLLIPFVFFSPSTMAGYVWVVGFGVARLAYTYSYLNARDNLRGLFMTLGLICMYGLASYLILAILKLL